MTDTQIPSEYTNANGDTLEILKDKSDRYIVRCWNKDQELWWEVSGVVVEDDGTRQKRRAFTEAEALAEFNRWR